MFVIRQHGWEWVDVVPWIWMILVAASKIKVCGVVGFSGRRAVGWDNLGWNLNHLQYPNELFLKVCRWLDLLVTSINSTYFLLSVFITLFTWAFTFGGTRNKPNSIQIYVLFVLTTEHIQVEKLDWNNVLILLPWKIIDASK